MNVSLSRTFCIPPALRQTKKLPPSPSLNPSRTSWFDTETAITLRSYHQLGRTRRHLYDNGKMFVLDLALGGKPNRRRSRCPVIISLFQSKNEPEGSEG
jgi:hypothetical protein